MSKEFLNTSLLPYCKGCGHDLTAKSSVSALEKIGYSALDVIFVTDIGCLGIIDKCLNTHTVHGLHGRSTALGAGISLGIENSRKKIVVFIGDGGATIGLQHILEAARLNLNMTVVLHNNMLYGMTGGQTSGLTPQDFATTTSSEGNPISGYDICKLTHAAGAAYVSRVIGIGNISKNLEEAFKPTGFSLIEVIEICPSYGVKLNPKRKLTEIAESAGLKTGVWINKRPEYKITQSKKVNDLLSNIKPIKSEFFNNLKKSLSIILSGSAGEGIQLAATILAKSAISSGLNVTQKGSYPVTVGVGFSTAEINLSPEKINFHGIDIPDVVIITSGDGLNHNINRINKMKKGMLFIDSSLKVPDTDAEVIKYDFRSIGTKNAAIASILYFVKISGIIATESVLKAIEQEPASGKIQIEKIRNTLQ